RPLTDPTLDQHSPYRDHTTTQLPTLSLHDALPISTAAGAVKPETLPIASFPSRHSSAQRSASAYSPRRKRICESVPAEPAWTVRSEEHTSELQSLRHLVCRLLLEKKKDKNVMIAVH